MQISWLPMNNGEYVAGLTISGYDKEEPSQQDLPAETTNKINHAVEDAFGISPDTMTGEDWTSEEAMS